MPIIRTKPKELLVIGWIRKNYNIPEDLIKVILLFCGDAIRWLIQDEKLKQIFAKMLSRYRDNYQEIIDLIEFRMMCFEFQLFVRSTQGHTALKISLKMIYSSKTMLGLKIAVKTKGNIGNTDTHLLNVSCQRKMEQDICTITAHEDIIEKYDKFDMLFSFEILEIKYHKMFVKDQLKWKLNTTDLCGLQSPSHCNYNQQEFDIISKQIDNNRWLLCIDEYQDGEENAINYNLGLDPLSLPPSIYELEIKYQLVISSNVDIVSNKGVIRMDKNGEYIYEWNVELFKDIENVEIVLDIEIMEIFARNSSRSIIKSCWSEFGFICNSDEEDTVNID